MAAESSKGIKQFKVPHVYAIIFALMVIFAVLTWIVPSGSYQRQEVNGREVTVAGTYEQSEKTYIDEETGVRTISWTAPRRIQASCGTPSGSATRGTS